MEHSNWDFLFDYLCHWYWRKLCCSSKSLLFSLFMVFADINMRRFTKMLDTHWDPCSIYTEVFVHPCWKGSHCFCSCLVSTFSAINRHEWTVVVAGLLITKVITDGLTMLDIQVVKLWKTPTYLKWQQKIHIWNLASEKPFSRNTKIPAHCGHEKHGPILQKCSNSEWYWIPFLLRAVSHLLQCRLVCL